MQTLLLKPDDHVREWLDERRRNGNDQRDEVWDGVLHVVPPPFYEHQAFESDLERVLYPLATACGLRIAHEVGVFLRADYKDYRVPDLVISDPRYISERGVEARAEIVIEVLSPDDESRKKFAFYASCEVPEVWIVHPTTKAIEVYVLADDRNAEQSPAPDGTISAPRLGLQLRVVDGPKLRITWADGSTEI